MTSLVFYLLAAVTIVGALGVVLQRNPVISALFLVMNLGGIAGLFFLLHAEFLGLIQIMVYAGAIVVLFLFVVMLLNLREGVQGADPQLGIKVLGLGALGLATVKLASVLGSVPAQMSEVEPTYGTTHALAVSLYTDYVLAFEVAGILLLAGIVAAVVLAKRSLS